MFIELPDNQYVKTNHIVRVFAVPTINYAGTTGGIPHSSPCIKAELITGTIITMQEYETFREAKADLDYTVWRLKEFPT